MIASCRSEKGINEDTVWYEIWPHCCGDQRGQIEYAVQLGDCGDSVDRQRRCQHLET